MNPFPSWKEKFNTELFSHPIRKDVTRIAWPVLAEMLLGSLFSMIDMMMLGRMADTVVATTSVAAVGITNQPLFIGLALVQSLNVGGTAMVSRFIGANQLHKVENIVKHVILLNLLIFAIPLSLLGILFTNPIMTFVGAYGDTVAIGSLYFKIIMLGFLFQALNFSLAACLRGAGDTRLPMKINLGMNFLNVLGNGVLIYGLFGFPQLGIIGAGISTSLSHLLASFILFSYVFKGKSIISLSFSPFQFQKDTIYNLAKIGIPASLEQISLRVGIVFFAKIVASLGTVTFAAHQICLSILGLSFNPGQAFGIAASALVGQSLGAGKPTRAQEYAQETRKIGSVVSSFIAFVFFLFGPQIVSLYTRDPEIIDSASRALKVIALVQPFQASQLILAGGLRGAGDTLWPLVATFIGVLGIRVVLSYVFVIFLGLGLIGAWVAVFIDQLVRWVLVYTRFQTGKWKYVSLQ